VAGGLDEDLMEAQIQGGKLNRVFVPHRGHVTQNCLQTLCGRLVLPLCQNSCGETFHDGSETGDLPHVGLFEVVDKGTPPRKNDNQALPFQLLQSITDRPPAQVQLFRQMSFNEPLPPEAAAYLLDALDDARDEAKTADVALAELAEAIGAYRADRADLAHLAGPGSELEFGNDSSGRCRGRREKPEPVI